MTPVEQGAYCSSCSKEVVDFTGMHDSEIIDYFQKRAYQPVCGRFRNEQLGRPMSEMAATIFSMEIPFWKKFLAALIIFFSAFIYGCSSNSQTDYTKVEVPQQTTASPVAKANLEIAQQTTAKPVTKKDRTVSHRETKVDDAIFMTLGYAIPERNVVIVPVLDNTDFRLRGLNFKNPAK